MNTLLKYLLLLNLFVFQVYSFENSVELVCSSDKDCKSFEDKFTESVCVHICSCFDRKNRTELPCTPKSLKVFNRIGECPCNNVLNTECIDNECVCKNGFIMTDDKIRCIAKVVQLGKSCDISDQCIRFAKNSRCSNHICQCNNNYLQVGKNNCKSLVYKDEEEIHCDEGNPCSKNQECFKGICVCVENFATSTINKTICLPHADYHDKCNETIQCKKGSLGDGSICENNLCKCDENHTATIAENKHICQRNVHHNDDCKKDSDCASYLDDPKMFCNKKDRCECRKGYRLIDGFQRKCVIMDENFRSSDSVDWMVISLIIGIILFVCALSFIVIYYCCKEEE